MFGFPRHVTDTAQCPRSRPRRASAKLPSTQPYSDHVISCSPGTPFPPQRWSNIWSRMKWCRECNIQAMITYCKIGLRTPTFGQRTTADMALLYVRTLEHPSTIIADSPNLPQVNLVHMSSVIILIGNPRTSRPHTFHFLLPSRHNRETQLLVATG
jgi:hypothetical protein